MKKQPQSDLKIASETTLPSGRKIGIGTGRLFDLASSFEKTGRPEEFAEVQQVNDARQFVDVVYYREPQKGTSSTSRARHVSAPRRTALDPYPSGFTLATIEDEMRSWSDDDQDAFLALIAGDEMQTLLKKTFRRVREAHIARKQRTGEPLTKLEKFFQEVRVAPNEYRRFHEASKRGKTEPILLAKWFRHDTWTARKGILLLMGLDPDQTVFEKTKDFLGQPLKEFWITSHLDTRQIDLTPWKLDDEERQKESALARKQGRHRLALAILARRGDTHEIYKEISQLNHTYTTMMSIWNSGEHPKRNPPAHYIAWAEAKDFEVPWMAWAKEEGLLSPEQQDDDSIDTSKRDRELQESANALAKRWRSEGKKIFSKRDIAHELACTEWCDMKANRIERIIRKEW